MKPNASEKLYVYALDKVDKDIEYIRKDAFIDKVWSWIDDNMLSSNQQDKSHFYYEQFINYMKGE